MDMTNENEDLATRVAKKKAEIEHYIGVLERYHQKNGNGRWYISGRTHLEELQAELVALEQEQASVQGHIDT